jgi:hypothetical protein
MLVMVASALIVSYSLYTFFGSSDYMMVTLPFSFYAVFRYWYLIEKGNGGKPFEVLRDKGFLSNLVLWLLIVGVLLYVDVQSTLEVIQNQLSV